MEEENKKKDNGPKVMQAEGEKPQQIKEKIDNTKNKTQKIKKIIEFMKKHPLLAKMIFWVVLAVIIIIIFISIIYTITTEKFSGASQTITAINQSIKNINSSSGSSGEGEATDLNYVESGANIEGNKYVLKFGNYSVEEKKQRVQKMKESLAKRDIEIYSNQCLLFLYELKQNGLDISLYTKGDLEAIYMFYKAQIATNCIDLRSVEESYDAEGNYIYPDNSIVPQYTDEKGKTKFGYGEENYDENNFNDDVVYGTVRIQRMTYNADVSGANEGKISNLSYISYTEFDNLLKNNKKDALKYFTIDSDYNLIVAGDSRVTTVYNLSGLDEYTDEEQDEIKGKYPNGQIVEDVYRAEEVQYNVYKCKSIPYQDYISKYSMNFEFLMSLLATTDDDTFSKEIAKIAEKSYMVITLHEEYSKLLTTVTTDYTNHEKIYAEIDAEYSAKRTEEVQTEVAISIETEAEDGTKIKKTVDTLLSENHWNDVEDKSTEEIAVENSRGNITHYEKTYTWTYEENGEKKEYKLETIKRNTTETAIKFVYLKTEEQEKEYENEVKNIFLTKDRTFIKDGYPLDEIKNLPPISSEEGEVLANSHLENLAENTKKITKEYRLVEETTTETNNYKIELTEVDNWYQTYKKTYSTVQEIPIGSDPTEYEEELEIKSDNIGTRTITDTDVINEIDYIGEITEDTKNDFIKTEVGKDDLYDMTFDIVKVEENFYKYGYANIKTESEGTKYAKGEDATEEVKIKVQNDNTRALLTITADANSSNKEAQGEDTEKIYGITDEAKNSFLYVYDKYDSVQDTFASIDEWTYEMLDSRGASITTTNLLKYLLFLYDGTDLGITEYDLNLFRPDEFKNANESVLLLKKYIHAWEHGSPPPTNEEGTCYIIEDDGVGHPTVGYGIDIENSGYKSAFIEAGYPTEIGGEVPIDFVDGIEEQILENMSTQVRSLVSDLNLTEYQINALISRAYNCGVYGAVETVRNGKSFKDAYLAFWNQAEDDKFSEKDSALVNYEHELYTTYMSSPVTSEGEYLAGLERRRKSEWVLFQTGYYDIIDSWHISGGKIIECAKYIHEYMEENSYTYCVVSNVDGDECSQYGKSHGLNTTFEKSKSEHHNTCCATYVSWVLQMAGYVTEEEHIENNLNGAHNMKNFLESKGWEKITNYQDLEPGDILYYSRGHVEIYAGDDTIYNAGTGWAIREPSPYYKSSISSMTSAYRAPN